jgi:hypothetical protein
MDFNVSFIRVISSRAFSTNSSRSTPAGGNASSSNGASDVDDGARFRSTPMFSFYLTEKKEILYNT